MESMVGTCRREEKGGRRKEEGGREHRVRVQVAAISSPKGPWP
jgi:hypothetical protein